jgi:hypothetical protein
VQAIGREPQRAPNGAPLHYERHRPEQTTLYRLVRRHAASFIAHIEGSVVRGRGSRTRKNRRTAVSSVGGGGSPKARRR